MREREGKGEEAVWAAAQKEGKGGAGELGQKAEKKKGRGRGKEFHFLFPFSNKFSMHFPIGFLVNLAICF